LAAYGFSACKDILQQLLDLNTAVAAAIDAGKTAIGPGIPPSYDAPEKLVTKDCLGE
jgi:hypothetical protein